VYLLVEQGEFPELEEEYIRDGVELAREQIARGEVYVNQLIQSNRNHDTGRSTTAGNI
jgi:hypothetical protein